jgi:hypothetical protein
MRRAIHAIAVNIRIQRDLYRLSNFQDIRTQAVKGTDLLVLEYQEILAPLYPFLSEIQEQPTKTHPSIQ